MERAVLAGIDMSAKELVVALERGKGSRWNGTFTNDSAGHRKLIGVLTRRGARAQVCLEATGIYHLELALALVANDRIALMVANPRATKDFARARLQRSKTDRTDAISILEFLRRMPFEAWNAPDPAILDLQALSRRISALLVSRAQEKNRLHVEDQLATRTHAIRASIDRHIDAINAEIDALTEAAVETLQKLPRLERRFALLTSVKRHVSCSALLGSALPRALYGPEMSTCHCLSSSRESIKLTTRSSSTQLANRLTGTRVASATSATRGSSGSLCGSPNCALNSR